MLFFNGERSTNSNILSRSGAHHKQQIEQCFSTFAGKEDKSRSAYKNRLPKIIRFWVDVKQPLARTASLFQQLIRQT
ncbi:MAG: hypothetical protein CMI06_10140 [Oceanospirillaceae bacterium]|nr:hypothetical protein [Oceanospirillaceae bacterium]